MLGGAALALALPVDASPATRTLAVPAASAAAERSDGVTASRSETRPAAGVAASPAVSAPDGTAPIAPSQVGVSGVKAVAKPTPKPVAPQQASSGGETADAAPSGSYSTSISGQCGGIGLISIAARLCSAVDSVFHLGSIGGYRPNAGEHSTGQAVDFMISSSSEGDAIAAWVQSHAGEFNVAYVIWRQRYWAPGGSWEMM